MKKRMGKREAHYIEEHLQQVRHVTLNPKEPGVVRVHLVPPVQTREKAVPWVVLLNGQDILPLSLSWAILLCAFIEAMSPYDGKTLEESDWAAITERTVKDTQTVYPRVSTETLRGDLQTIFDTFVAVARGQTPSAEIGLLSIGEYAEHMRAPHRIDLMVSAMERDGKWNCNQRCLHCYAAGQALSGTGELSAEQWKRILQLCRTSCIPQVTFTGGEPTMRDDLVELVDAARFFVTRLNTNGVRLTPTLCRALYEASLDSVQVTLYAADAAAHNRLVGAENWDKTVEGIRAAVGAGLNVSVNTPLCTVNTQYLDTLELVFSLGVRYVTCSGLILTGNATGDDSAETRLGGDELTAILREAFAFCREREMEISFTSPGWVDAETLREIGFPSAPTCGACLSNMAVAPDGTVIPCQSWLRAEDALGNLLTDDWEKIWNGARCREIRAQSAKMEGRCQLRTKEGI